MNQYNASVTNGMVRYSIASRAQVTLTICARKYYMLDCKDLGRARKLKARRLQVLRDRKFGVKTAEPSLHNIGLSVG